MGQLKRIKKSITSTQFPLFILIHLNEFAQFQLLKDPTIFTLYYIVSFIFKYPTILTYYIQFLNNYII